MRLRIAPVHGYGWSSQSGFAETPSVFEMDAEILKSGEPFATALGFVTHPNHPLNELWVLLAQRTKGVAPHYNLYAFRERPELHEQNAPLPEDQIMTGFATISLT